MERNRSVTIIVSGSLAYDRIMDFPGYFSDHILPEKIHVLNVAFMVNGVREKFGGTAGNIAYALALMGQSPEISATIGNDYHRYLDWLKKNGLPLGNIKIIEKELTAGAYITTDRADNQITGFNPGAMKCSSELNFELLKPQETLMIISPGNLEDMIQYPRKCKTRGIDYIFDPGQSIPMLGPSDLLSAIEGCRILISNDYELELIMNKTGMDKSALLQKAGSIIITLGDMGSRIFTADSEKFIPAVEPARVEDPTGAGDSYRGGLLSGLVKGMDIEQAAQVGSVCASFAVECYGTQEYTFDTPTFEARYKRFFG
jgi:adenosine kinase